jgi:hypothetical protein
MKRGCLVCAVVFGGLIVGWLVWAVGQAQEASRRAQCVSHLKWIALALQNYHSRYGSLPPGTIPNPHLPPERRLSWVVEVDPEMRVTKGTRRCDRDTFASRSGA